MGLTDLSAAELERRRQRAQFGLGVQAQMQSIDNQRGLSPAERDARKVGAIFGNFFGSRLAETVTDDETRNITAVQAAQGKLQALQKVQPGLTGELAQEKFQQILAGELQRVGSVEKSLEVGKAATQAMRARRTQELELKRLGISTERDEIARDLDKGKATRDLRGQVNPIWPKGATREDEAVMGFLQNDGTVVDSNGQEYPLGEFSIYPPPKQEGTGRKLTANDLGISDREQKEIRDQVASIGAMARGAVDMRDALAEAAASGKGINIMDGTGKVTGVVTKALEIFSGVSRNIGATLEVVDADGRSQGDLSQGPAADRHTKKNFAEIDKVLFDLVPENLRRSEITRAKYYSALTRITYAQARSNEPGARQLSDEDFRRSLVQMAGNASDPEAFRGVMENNMKEAVNAMDMRTKIIGEDRMELIVAKPGMNAMRKELARFDAAFSSDFGSAAEPSEALTGTDEVTSTSGATIKFLN
jgi:hypothetical protein